MQLSVEKPKNAASCTLKYASFATKCATTCAATYAATLRVEKVVQNTEYQYFISNLLTLLYYIILLLY
jgi:hypothetical protein